jgi:hypothetical protein
VWKTIRFSPRAKNLSAIGLRYDGGWAQPGIIGIDVNDSAAASVLP